MHDKALHFIAGVAIAAPFAAVGYPIHAAAAAVLAAVAKEAWDMLGNGTPDVMDAFATIAGGALVTVCLM